MENRLKEVDFHKYCKKCKHRDKHESEDPCWDCLDQPVNEDSKKPIYFEDRDKK